MSPLRLAGCLFVLFVALVFSAATIGFLKIGFDNNWTSDGPGMLAIMLGAAFCGLFAFIAWGAVLAVMAGKQS